MSFLINVAPVFYQSYFAYLLPRNGLFCVLSAIKQHKRL